MVCHVSCVKITKHDGGILTCYIKILKKIWINWVAGKKGKHGEQTLMAIQNENRGNIWVNRVICQPWCQFKTRVPLGFKGYGGYLKSIGSYSKRR